jgi:4-hydroxythreonine-4-phosphate dehydrogenase
LLARLLAEPDIRPLAKFVIFGDARVLDMGAKVAGTNPDVARAKSETALRPGKAARSLSISQTATSTA